MAILVNVTVDFVQVGAGTGSSMLGQAQANVPGQGQSEQPHAIGSGQTMRLSVCEPVAGTAGSYALSDILTALETCASDLAGASGTPIIDATTLAQLNAWETGGG